MFRVASLLAAAWLMACRQAAPIIELAPADIETSIFLIGDAGAPNPRSGNPALDSLSHQAAAAPERALIVFLGDNVYPAGVPEAGAAEWADAKFRLESQVVAVPRGARGIFVPGNADWAHSQVSGLKAIRLQSQMIRSLADGRDVSMLPDNGCPGPDAVDRGRARVILLDTQWWLHEYVLRDEQTDCATRVDAVTAALREQVRPSRNGQVVIVAAHHPLMTGGEHGGYCGISGPFRRFGGRAQDIISSSNRTMRDSLRSAFSAHPPLVHAAGHEHNLQVLRGSPVANLLVSGAGSASKASCAVKLRESRYTSQHRAGFMRLDVLRDRGVLLRVYRYDRHGDGGLAYSDWLEPR